MDKKRSSQPTLNDDQKESSTKDLDSQVSSSHKMPGGKHTKAKSKDKGTDMKGNRDADTKKW